MLKNDNDSADETTNAATDGGRGDTDSSADGAGRDVAESPNGERRAAAAADGAADGAAADNEIADPVIYEGNPNHPVIKAFKFILATIGVIFHSPLNIGGLMWAIITDILIQFPKAMAGRANKTSIESLNRLMRYNVLWGFIVHYKPRDDTTKSGITAAAVVSLLIWSGALLYYFISDFSHEESGPIIPYYWEKAVAVFDEFLTKVWGTGV